MPKMTRALCLAAASVLAFTSLGMTQGTKAPTVTVVVDKQTYQVSSSARSVGDVLIDLGLTLGDLDRTTPPLTAPLKDRMTIHVIRVSCRRVVEDVKVPAGTTLLPVANRPLTFTKVISEGRDGLVRRVVDVWERDGEVTKKDVVREKVLVAAEDRIVMRSAGGLPTRGGNYRRPLRMWATAYEPGPRSCGAHADGRTATGMKAAKGVVAVDTRVLPFGTRMYIPGYGFAVAADRGSAIKGNRIDLCFNTYHEAIHFGSRWVDVYLLPKKR